MLKSWCPEWNPRWWMTDKCAAELRAIRDVFPGKEWHFTSSNSNIYLEKSENENSLEAFTSNRLIPLNKNPGLRPIGVGEVLRRIAGKVVMFIAKKDVKEAAGSLQVCAGQESGSEAAVHAIYDIFKKDETEAVLLVDAENAFNSINRKAMLHNISIICPIITTFISNCYIKPARLFVVD